MRETMLKLDSIARKRDRWGYRQLERFRKQADYEAKLYNIDRKSQIQSLIAIVSAWQ